MTAAAESTTPPNNPAKADAAPNAEATPATTRHQKQSDTTARIWKEAMTAESVLIPPLGRLPASGDVLWISRSASPQFTTPFQFRVIRQYDFDDYQRSCWIDGYQLDTNGTASLRRSLYVFVDGLRVIR